MTARHVDHLCFFFETNQAFIIGHFVANILINLLFLLIFFFDLGARLRLRRREAGWVIWYFEPALELGGLVVAIVLSWGRYEQIEFLTHVL
jgi:hypothetical protein